MKKFKIRKDEMPGDAVYKNDTDMTSAFIPLICILGIVSLALVLLLVRSKLENKRRKTIEAQLKLKSDQLRSEAELDALTGLLNRRSFERGLTEVTNADRCFALMIIDLDDFKNINDKYGHLTGDLVLKEVGFRLNSMTTTQKMMRQLPGRIVGQTEDSEGNVCYVLTLQAREQHIRREKASSNICSNEALCALTATVYLSAMGPEGLRQAAELSVNKAHYLQKELEKAGFAPAYPDAEFFKEFVTESPVPPERLMAELEKHGILGGLPLEDGKILWCATEKNTREDIDDLVTLAGEVIC